MQACRAAGVLEPPRDLEARILLSTMPETAMTCEDFEECLTDYLDGFLPASSIPSMGTSRAALSRCTELPGEVVRAIGTCYIYLGEEKPIPAGLNERILQATFATELRQEIRASFGERMASWLRVWLDPIISPQLATVATMLLVAVFVLTNTVSADGSISGVYSASLRLAERSTGNNGGIKEITKGLKELVGGQRNSTTEQAPATAPERAAETNRNRSQRTTESIVAIKAKAKCCIALIIRRILLSSNVTSVRGSCVLLVIIAFADFRFARIASSLELSFFDRTPKSAPLSYRNSSPFMATLLSFVPGLGAAYNGQTAKAIVHFAIFASFFQMAVLTRACTSSFWVFWAHGCLRRLMLVGRPN